ncbi:baculoviral IAP repeat-containing protein 7 [Monodelphis domestica]|uniref:RING-type E3 ubiquitin transferase n=1 Tax=Monodelphis domestica TaxID=13616 RepID=A0A5F8HG31_MONDO|nr:baculoviral IAP repeat-containing protein 7 [Monodelphis domestica]
MIEMPVFISQFFEGETTQLWGRQEDPSVQEVEPRMGSEASRRKTFQDWPPEGPVSPQDLARAGFFYVGPQDRVQCFCCGGMLDNWMAGDSPILEHQRFFPKCQFALSKHTGNIPAQDTSDSVDGQILSQLQRISEEGEGEGNEDTVTTRPVYPDMGVEQIRLASFHNWPSAAVVCPQQLARAGFFYTGQHDHVKCYYCDGGLRNWDRGDDPWREHAKWFPRCEFLLQSRGRAYVNSIQDSSSLLDSWGHGEDPQEVAPTSTPGSPGSLAWLAWPAWRQSTVVKSVLQMGFEQSMVERLVLSKYRLATPASTSVSQLVSDLIQEEETNATETRASVPMASESTPPRRESQPEQITETGPLSTEQQLQQLKEERTCKVCMYQVVSIVFVPCGHLVCSECAPNLQQCPICRAAIHGSIRTFLS